jgi:hypothetical protein
MNEQDKCPKCGAIGIYHEYEECLERQLAAMTERAEKAEAVVAKLPRTKDGVSVVPGEDTVWQWECRGGKYQWVECEINIDYGYLETETDLVNTSRVPQCYSTREVAEAAAVEGGEK